MPPQQAYAYIQKRLEATKMAKMKAILMKLLPALSAALVVLAGGR